MNKEALEIFKICMKLKEKGHDAFFDYAPHVNSIYVYVYENGWLENKDAILRVNCYIRNCSAYSEKETKEEIANLKSKLLELLK